MAATVSTLETQRPGSSYLGLRRFNLVMGLRHLVQGIAGLEGVRRYHWALCGSVMSAGSFIGEPRRLRRGAST